MSGAMLCPFCGSGNIAIVIRFNGPGQAVKCQRCKAMGPKGKDREEAVRSWNTRDGEEVTEGEVADISDRTTRG